MHTRMLGAMLLTAGLVSAGEPVDPEAKFIGNRGKYWAFQPVIRPAAPVVSDPWVRTPIDAFILSALRAKKLTPSQPLDRTQLVRRLTFDLIWLPQTPKEVETFVREYPP